MRIVPKLVPVEVETMAQMRKLAATYQPPARCACRASQMSASTNPVRAMTAPSAPASSQAVIMTITIGRLMPARTTSQ